LPGDCARTVPEKQTRRAAPGGEIKAWVPEKLPPGTTPCQSIHGSRRRAGGMSGARVIGNVSTRRWRKDGPAGRAPAASSSTRRQSSQIRPRSWGGSFMRFSISGYPGESTGLTRRASWSESGGTDMQDRAENSQPGAKQTAGFLAGPFPEGETAGKASNRLSEHGGFRPSPSHG
jgi:hypothetical protein